MKKFFFLATLFCCGLMANCQPIPSVKMKQLVDHFSKKGDSVYVINFWASFCKPCVEELPYVQSLVKKYATQKVKLILVSLDLPSFYPTQIRKFADKHDIKADIVWLNETNADYFCPMIDKKWSGTIPATLFTSPITGKKLFFEDQMTELDFEKALKTIVEN